MKKYMGWGLCVGLACVGCGGEPEGVPVGHQSEALTQLFHQYYCTTSGYAPGTLYTKTTGDRIIWSWDGWNWNEPKVGGDSTATSYYLADNNGGAHGAIVQNGLLNKAATGVAQIIYWSYGKVTFDPYYHCTYHADVWLNV